MPRKQNPETQLKRAIKQVLNGLRIFNFPILQGIGAYKGISDMMALRKAPCPHCGEPILHFYAIEVKRPKGRLNDYQAEFLFQVEQAGGKPIVARSVTDVIEGMNLQNNFLDLKPRKKGGKK